LFDLVLQGYSPAFLISGINFEETGFVETAYHAAARSPDLKRLVFGAHIELRFAFRILLISIPYSGPVIVHGVNIIIAGDELPLYQRPTDIRWNVPPAFTGPPGGILVTDYHTDTAGCGVAELEIGISGGSEKEHPRDRKPSE
jgi:hypothetical protein